MLFYVLRIIRNALIFVCQYARQGDTIVVWRRSLGRNMQDLIDLVNNLNDQSIGFHSIDCYLR